MKPTIYQLKNCPFCDGKTSVESNRDWHKVTCEHGDDCILLEFDPMFPATDEGLSELIQMWNTRAETSQVTADEARLDKIILKIKLHRNICRRRKDKHPESKAWDDGMINAFTICEKLLLKERAGV